MHKVALILVAFFFVGCEQNKQAPEPANTEPAKVEQSKKDALQIICDSQVKGHTDGYIAENVTNPEMATFFTRVRTGEITGDPFREQLRILSKETGVQCELLTMLDRLNNVMTEESPETVP